jgi:hypothetical protein
MPIEFRCSTCGKLLRTPDGTAGQPAQCPECGTVTTIPGTPGAAPSPQPAGSSFGPAGATEGGNPFAAGSTPSGAGNADNPYQSPTTAGYAAAPLGQGSAYAAQRVAGPATALIVTAWIGIVLQALGIVANLAQVGLVAPRMQHMHNRGPDVFPLMMGGGINVVVGVFGLAMGVLILVGATKMKKLESYSLSMAGAIVAMIPCISPCCLLGLPFGIWALVVLCDSPVKSAFRS